MDKNVVPLSFVVLLFLLAACGVPEAAVAPLPVGAAVATPDAGIASAPTGVSVATADVGSATTVAVSIAELAFQPHTLVVAPGTEVSWRNGDAATHTVRGEADGFESGPLGAGESFTHRFDAPGTFRYRCSTHPSMEGVILVAPTGAGTSFLFDGKAVDEAYRDSCGGCHGPQREGATGPALIPGRLAASDDVYVDVIKNGKPGTIMPAWAALGMTDEEIWALVGYLRSEPDAEAVRWEMEQIAASRTVLVDEAALPAAPTHTGNLENLMLVTEREARSIAVIDGDTHRLLAHIQASYRAHGYAFDPTSDRWAYNVGRDGWLFKIDLYSLQAVTKVRVGLDSRGLAISDDGRYIIAGNYIPNSAVILDAGSLEPRKVIITEGTNPQGEFVASRVAIVSDVSPEKVGPYFILALKEAGQMWRVDYSRPDFPIERVEGVGNILHDGFLSPDNRFFYIASQRDDWMAVIDVARWELTAKIPTGLTPHPGSGATWEIDGTTYGATVHAAEGKITVWDLSDNQIAATIQTSGPGLFIRSHPGGRTVWADTMFGDPPNRIYVFDAATFEVVKVIDDGVQTLHPEFTHDGAFVYVADWQGSVVRVYDAETFALVAEVGGLTTPTGIFSTSRRTETLGH